MTNKEKLLLQLMVRYLIGDGKRDSEIITQLQKEGFKRAAIKKYIKAFTK